MLRFFNLKIGKRRDLLSGRRFLILTKTQLKKYNLLSVSSTEIFTQQQKKICKYFTKRSKLQHCFRIKKRTQPLLKEILVARGSYMPQFQETQYIIQKINNEKLKNVLSYHNTSKNQLEYMLLIALSVNFYRNMFCCTGQF